MLEGINLDRLRALATAQKDESGKNLRDLNSEIGVHYGTMSRFLRGGSPDVLTFCRVCAWLDVDPRLFYVAEAERKTKSSKTPKPAETKIKPPVTRKAKP